MEKVTVKARLGFIRQTARNFVEQLTLLEK